MKGIVLAGGYGTRLFPLTSSVSKQLLPVFDKPLIYYSITTLMSANINEILIITTEEFILNFKKLLGNGSNFGIKISYAIQKKPYGIAHAFIIAEKFINKKPIALILGDNIFYGIGKIDFFNYNFSGAKIFLYDVPDPQNYGVVNIKNNKIISIEEKPKKPKSSKVITGLYLYDKDVVSIAKKLKPSKRNELEITDINKNYLKINKLQYTNLSEGSVWLDAGTTTSLLQASQYVQTVQERQKLQVGCPEEIAYKNKWLSKNKLKKIIKKMPVNSYSNYLKKIL